MSRFLYLGMMAMLIYIASNNSPTTAKPIYTGVNLAGAEFTPNQIPGKYNTHYTYPTQAEINYFTEKGANTFRLPFLWERLQRTLNGDFDTAELQRISRSYPARLPKGHT